MERKAAMEFIKQLISTKKVVVFSKTKCPYCVKAKEVLKFYNLPAEHYQVLELDGRSDMDAVQDALGEITGARTVPRIFIDAKSIGGYTDLHKLHENGELGRLLENLGLTE